MRNYVPTLNEYQEAIRPLARYREDLTLHYTIPALVREVDELIEEFCKPHPEVAPNVPLEILFELGDCVWMIGAALDKLGVLLEMYDVLRVVPFPPITQANILDGLDHASSKALDMWVKVVRDQAGDPNGRKLELATHLSTAMYYAVALAEMCGTNIGTIMHMNLVKLKHPDYLPAK